MDTLDRVTLRFLFQAANIDYILCLINLSKITQLFLREQRRVSQLVRHNTHNV